MPITTTANIVQLQQRVMAATRLTLKDDQMPIKNGFHVERGRPGMDDTMNWPKLPGVTAFGLSEGVDMVSETIVDSNMSVAATEVGVAVEFSRKMLRTLPSSGAFQRNVGKAMGSAISVKQEQDVATLVDGFGTVVGLDGAPATIGQLSAAQSQLRANSEPLNSAMMGQIRSTITPAMWHDLAQLLFPTGSGDSHAPNSPTGEVGQRTFSRYGPAGSYFGTPIYLSTNLVASGNNTRAGVWHPDAGLFYEFMPEDPYVDDSDKSLRSIEMGIVIDYGYGEANDGFGREWDADSTSPTS